MQRVIGQSVDMATLLSIAILTAAAGSSSTPTQTMVLTLGVGFVAVAAIVLARIARRTRSLVG